MIIFYLFIHIKQIPPGALVVQAQTYTWHFHSPQNLHLAFPQLSVISSFNCGKRSRGMAVFLFYFLGHLFL